MLLQYIFASMVVVQMILAQPDGPKVDPELRELVTRFAAAADAGDVDFLAKTYSADFVNVRVSDDGGFVQLSRDQILLILSPKQGGTGPAFHPVPVKETVIHYANIAGNIGFVMMTRVKDMGNGWEPMVYTLVWQKQEGQWKLQREFVHQKTLPKR